MRPSLIRTCVLVTGLAVVGMTSRTIANNPHADFGTFVANQLSEHSEQLFGFRRPLEEERARPLRRRRQPAGHPGCPRPARVARVQRDASAADQIALWPNDDHPTHLFVCDEETSNPAVQRVDLSRPANANATTIVTGLTFLRSGATDTVGHHHRRRRGWSDGRPLRAHRSGAHHDADQRDRPRRGDDERSAASREAQGGRQPLVRELRDQEPTAR